jgi:hypothetical protein
MGWRNGGLPETWKIGIDDAQAIVGSLEKHGDRRSVYAETNIVFHDVERREGGGWLFDTEIIGTDLYAHKAHTTKVGTLPVN